MHLHRAEQDLKGQMAVNAELLKQNGLLQEKLHTANDKVVELQQRNNELAELYEGKIGELKVLVERKAAQLQRLSCQVLPKFDQDMLRIKLLNELELPHREEMEAKEEQIKKLETAAQELQKLLELESEKMTAIEQHRQEELKMVQAAHNEEITRLMRQLSQVVSRETTGKESYRRLKRENQELKNKLTLTRKDFQQRLEEAQNIRHDNANTYKYHTEINNLKKDVEHTRLLLRDSKQENAKLFRELQKSREDYSKLALKWQEQETVLNEHKDRERTTVDRLEELQKQSGEAEALQNQLKSLKRELDASKEQTVSDANKIKYLQKELSQAYETQREAKRPEVNEPAKQPIVSTAPSSRPSSKSVDELRLISDLTEAKSKNLQLIQQMTGTSGTILEKQRQLQTALTELETLKRHTRVQPTTRDLSPEDSTKLQDLKNKLRLANSTIVQLLKEKVAAGRASSPGRSFYR